MKKRIITIDIETLPTSEPFESKLFWETEEEYRKTGLDSSLGRILCIGYCEENEHGEIIEKGCFGWNEITQSFETDETILLNDFWNYVKGFQHRIDLLIGHNIFGFDLPFIIQRSVIHDIKPTVNFDMNKYHKFPIFDTMLRWDFYVFKKMTSLKKLAFAMGLKCPKSGDIDGSKIKEAFDAGKFEEIHKYCLQDVEATHNIWRKMNFKFKEEAVSKVMSEMALAA